MVLPEQIWMKDGYYPGMIFQEVKDMPLHQALLLPLDK